MDQYEILAIEGFAFDVDVRTTTKKRASKSKKTRLLKKRNISPSPAGGEVEIVSVGEVLCDDTMYMVPTLPLPLDDEFGTNATTDDLMDLLMNLEGYEGYQS